MKELSYEEKRSRVENFRIIDDVFFECLALDIEVDTEILRTLLEDPKLEVIDVVVQSDQRNLYGRSVRLDALCTLGDGTLCNIEVQRSDKDDHMRRARFNASSITVKESEPGDLFKDVKEVYVVYISEFDFIKGGKTIYHIDKVIRETGEKIDDGLHEIFVNTAINDESDISDLMSCFTKKYVEDPKFPKLSARVSELKTTEGGLATMCTIMEGYMEESRAEGRIEGRIEGRAEERIENIAMLLSRGGTVDQAKLFLDATDEEIELARKNMINA